MTNFQTIGVWWDNLKVVNCFRTSLTNRLIGAKNDFARGNESRSAEIRDLECSLSSLPLREPTSDLARNGLKKVSV